MTTSPPENWIKVSKETLIEFLAQCHDYRRTSYQNADSFYFAHNSERFAYWDHNQDCWIHPKHLKL